MSRIFINEETDYRPQGETHAMLIVVESSCNIGDRSNPNIHLVQNDKDWPNGIMDRKSPEGSPSHLFSYDMTYL
jgi:hypothetical protein